MKIIQASIRYLLLCSTLLTAASGYAQGPSPDQLARGFTAPPDSVQTSIYWHWISGNISREGVEKDLEAMKQAGINRAFIGNIGLPAKEVPTGPVTIFSDAWWEITHAALKKAAELGIEIGIFNSPGWSQAGGPWVKDEESMRYLASTTAHVEGGRRIEITLDRPEGSFQDVKVLAYPVQGAPERIIRKDNATVHVTPATENAQNLIDGQIDSQTTFACEGEVVLDFRAQDSIDLQSLTIWPSENPIRCTAKLSVLRNGSYILLREFAVERYNKTKATGFSTYAPVCITIASTPGREFRLTLDGVKPGNGIKEISLSSRPQVEHYAEKTYAKMFQTPLPYWNEYRWAAQPEPRTAEGVTDPATVLDISGALSGDRLSWEAPRGQWQIVRFGMVPTGVKNSPALADGTGNEVDKMSRQHLAAHFDSFIGKILDRIPAQDRRTWKVVVADSYEKGGQNFTDDFLETFEKRYGYSALPYLPVYNGVVVGSRDHSDRFLWDMRRMVADRLSYDHVGALREISHRNGFTIWLENYGHWGFPGEFLQYGGQADEVAGEFWSAGELGNIENRAASSAAHIYGKRKVSSESFTSGGKAYSRYPATMKQRGDRFFSEGINNTLLHVCITQPDEKTLPGINAPYGNEFNRSNTWYAHLDLFTLYLKRVNFLLQQGLNVADVCYFIGEDTPKMTGINDPALPAGHQFDYINAEVILRDMTVKEGMMVLPHGTSYKVMVLPPQTTMRPEVAAKLRELVDAGAVLLGPKPSRSPSMENYPEADRQVREIADQLWGSIDGERIHEARFGKGRVFSGKTLEEVAGAIGLTPDCSVPDGTPVLYAHRDLGASQIYFLTNQSDRTIRFDADFRISGLRPELWHPTLGERRELPAYSRHNGRTTVPLQLEPLESVFIVFAKSTAASGKGDAQDNFPAPHATHTIESPWTASFDGLAAPEGPVTFERPQDLSLSQTEAIRHFSGTIGYENTFVAEALPAPGERVFVNTSEVGVMAKVFVNGQYAGGVWTYPYKTDITELIRRGKNDIRIEVTTTWLNRLIGDRKLPETERHTWTPNNPWEADSPLQPSGLLHPVRIETLSYTR